jgi:hypothetical protein
MISIWTGFVAGSLHVVSGPDHIAALAPIAVDHPRRAARMGGLWGLGHGSGVVILGALGIWARDWVNLDAISAWSEYLVGFLLLGLGLWAFRVASRIEVHSHDHVHDSIEEHAHLHVHMSEEQRVGSHARHGHAAFGVGVLHGAAGAGHLFGVLPSLAMPTGEAVLYLLAYFFAAVVAMVGVGLGLGQVAAGRSTRFMRQLMRGCGLVALAVGGFWLSLGSLPF